VNKPPGWHAVPNLRRTAAPLPRQRRPGDESAGDGDDRCLWTHLRLDRRLGGGSDQGFLLPVHRVDQPCSGIQLYAKTRRAASALQSGWNARVRKSYLAVLESPRRGLEELREASSSSSSFSAAAARPPRTEGEVSGSGVAVGSSSDHGGGSEGWYELRGLLDRRRTARRRGASAAGNRGGSAPAPADPSSGGWSVGMAPVPPGSANEEELAREHGAREPGRYRLCSLRFRPLCEDRGLLLIDTSQGARHMIRSLLSSVGRGRGGGGASTTCLAGDLRYGASRPLRDGSVALHARELEILLPGDPAPPERRRTRAAPPLLRKLGGAYVAPVPGPWKEFFGISERLVADSLSRAAATSPPNG
jgi:hypothetical protein